MPLGKSERLHKYAVTCWIGGSTRALVRYEFGSKIDEEARVTCFVYVRFKYSIFNRLFRRGQLEKSRLIARIGGKESEFLYNFNTVREIVWAGYGHKIPFRFCGPEEHTAIQFSHGFLGKVKLYFVKAWRAVRSG